MRALRKWEWDGKGLRGWAGRRDRWLGGRSGYLGISSLKRLRWHSAGMTKARTEHAREPMREMKKPNPGTNMATRPTMTTMNARITRYTTFRLLRGTFCRNQGCGAKNTTVRPQVGTSDYRLMESVAE